MASTEAPSLHGVEITAANFHYLSRYIDRYSDLYLQAAAQFGGPGPGRVAEMLLQIPLADRAAANSEAMTRVNMRGFHYSEAAWHVVVDYLNGRDWQHYSNLAKEIAAAEQENQRAALAASALAN